MANDVDININATDNTSDALNKASRNMDKMGKKAKEAAKKTDQLSDEMQDVNKDSAGLTRGLGNVGSAFGTVTAAIGAATVALAGISLNQQRWAELGREIKQSAQQVGVSTLQWQRYSHVVNLVGGDVDDLKGAFEELNIRSTEAAQGNRELQQQFERTGIAFRDFIKLSPAQQMDAIAEAARNMGSGAERVEFLDKALGGDGFKLIPFIEEDLRALGDEAQRFGLILDDEAIEAANEFSRAIAELDARLTGLGNVLALRVSPEITAFVNSLLPHIETVTGLFAGDMPVNIPNPNLIDGAGGGSGTGRDGLPSATSSRRVRQNFGVGLGDVARVEGDALQRLLSGATSTGRTISAEGRQVEVFRSETGQLFFQALKDEVGNPLDAYTIENEKAQQKIEEAIRESGGANIFGDLVPVIEDKWITTVNRSIAAQNANTLALEKLTFEQKLEAKLQEDSRRTFAPDLTPEKVNPYFIPPYPPETFPGVIAADETRANAPDAALGSGILGGAAGGLIGLIAGAGAGAKAGGLAGLALGPAGAGLGAIAGAIIGAVGSLLLSEVIASAQEVNPENVEGLLEEARQAMITGGSFGTPSTVPDEAQTEENLEQTEVLWTNHNDNVEADSAATFEEIRAAYTAKMKEAGNTVQADQAETWDGVVNDIESRRPILTLGGIELENDSLLADFGYEILSGLRDDGRLYEFV